MYMTSWKKQHCSDDVVIRWIEMLGSSRFSSPREFLGGTEMFCILIGVVVVQVYICVKTHRNVHTHIHFTLCKQNKKRIHILRMCAQMFKMLRTHHQKSLELRQSSFYSWRN